jgi:hypothetical protein
VRGTDWDSIDWSSPDEQRPERTGAPAGEAENDSAGWDVPARPGPGKRGKLVIVLVMTVVMLVTIALCCMAAGQIGQLLPVQLPPP